jgi:hypothetical protein
MTMSLLLLFKIEKREAHAREIVRGKLKFSYPNGLRNPRKR